MNGNGNELMQKGSMQSCQYCWKSFSHNRMQHSIDSKGTVFWAVSSGNRIDSTNQQTLELLCELCPLYLFSECRRKFTTLSFDLHLHLRRSKYQQALKQLAKDLKKEIEINRKTCNEFVAVNVVNQTKFRKKSERNKQTRFDY